MRRFSATRDEVGELLRDLADRISGSEAVDIGGATFTVPEVSEVKLKFRRKESRAKLKISLAWPEGGLVSGTLLDHYELPDAPPADFKQLKKEMQHSLYYFRRLGEAGKCPSAGEIDRYRRLQDAFARSAKPGWEAGVEESAGATDALAEAARIGDAAAVGAAVERLLAIKKIYHERYK